MSAGFDVNKVLKHARRRRLAARIKRKAAALVARVDLGEASRYVTAELIARELVRTTETLPIVSRLSELFTDRRMFESFDRFGSAGFRLVDHAENKVMAGGHKEVPGYLFKKYNNDKPAKKQILNYMRRVEGARLLRAFITKHGFSRVVAPRKWLYELPADFPARYLVVAQKLDLSSDTDHHYDRIDSEQVRELATILYYFRGLNSTAANLPFTEEGRVAFIDTERWANGKDFLRKVGDRLPSDQRKLAEEIYEELRRKGAQPVASAFKRVSARAVQRAEQDFDREEDTSS